MNFKFLKAADFAALSAKAEAFDKISAVLNTEEGAEMTAEQAVEKFATLAAGAGGETSDNDALAALQTSLDEVTAENSRLSAENDSLAEQVTNLQNNASAAGAKVKAKGEVKVEEGDAINAALDGKEGADFLAEAKANGLL
ncbi:MAG: hypothetical protein ACRC9X_06310 [Bacteroidales bacterium]